MIFKKTLLSKTIIWLSSSVTGIGCAFYGTHAFASPVLEEIIVTAQKQDQTVSSVGASISAVSADQLALRDLANTQDIAISIPNLNYGEVGGAALVTIRGIGLNVESGFAEPAVAMYIDGIYIGRASAATLGLSDLTSVEVLRGPQGTLYGRNATGGVVNYITKKPTKDFEAGLNAGVGSYGASNGNGHISGPLSEDFAGRLTVNYKNDDGYFDNKLTGNDEGGRELFSYKGALTWDILESLSADIAYSRISQTWVGPNLQKVTPSAFVPVGAMVDPGPRDYYHNIVPEANTDVDIAAFTLSWDIDEISVRSVTGYTNLHREDVSEADFLSLDILKSVRDERSETFSEELNVSGNIADRLDWIVGAFFFEEHSSGKVDILGGSDVVFLGPFTPGGLVTENFLREDLSAQGYFTDLTYHLTDTLRLKGGFRYSQEEKTADQTVTSPFGSACVNQQTTGHWYDGSPKFGMEWNFSDDLMAYATYQKGFKSGGFNQSGCDQFEPEEITSYELGVKGSLMDDRMYFAASYFHYDYKNMQTLRIVGGVLAIIENAGQSIIDGVEIENKFAVTDNVSIDLNIAWLDATYDQFIDGAGNDYSGNVLNRSPEYSAFAGVEYAIPVDGGVVGEIRLRAEGSWSDDVYFSPANVESERQPAYGLINIFAVVNSKDERYQVKAFVKNVENKDYFVSNTGLFEDNTAQYGAPRTWGVEASVKWF